MEIIELQARYGYKHTLTHLKDNLWKFDPDPKSCGTFRIIGFDGQPIGSSVYAFDPEGGPFMSVGSTINNKIIKSISSNGIFELE